MKTRSFFLCESGAGAPGPLVLTENKSMTGRREKDSGFFLGEPCTAAHGPP